MIISITFRGEEQDIKVTSKLEPYDWHFLDIQLNKLTLTNEEEEEIYQIIYQAIFDDACNNDW